MKVLVISSSPRKTGNSEVLCQQFAKGAATSGHDVELLNLNDYHIGYCQACEYCRTHDNTCVLQDDANIIVDKIIQADVFMMATPVYFYGMSGQLKVLIDRIFAREHEIRDSKKRKKAYLAITSGSPDIEQMKGITESFNGFLKVLRQVDNGGIIDGLGAFHLGDINNHKGYHEAYETGKNI